MSDGLREAVSDGVGQAKQKGLDLLSGTQKAFNGIAGEAVTIGKTAVERQKDNLADELTNVSRALRSASESFSQNSSSGVGKVGEAIVDRVAALAESLRDKDVDQIISDTEAFARSKPVTYVVAAVAIGFVTARFLKSRSAA